MLSNLCTFCTLPHKGLSPKLPPYPQAQELRKRNSREKCHSPNIKNRKSRKCDNLRQKNHQCLICRQIDCCCCEYAVDADADAISRESNCDQPLCGRIMPSTGLAPIEHTIQSPNLRSSTKHTIYFRKFFLSKMKSLTIRNYHVCCKSWFKWTLLAKIVFYMIVSSILFNNMFSQIKMASANKIQPVSDMASVNETGVCQSVDIRNKPSELRRLTNCRVIEGFLQILLIDRFEESDYDNFSFPLLTEITDYLLLYRVNGLKSLSKLFPNLSVIRGNQLFINYALIIYEVMNIQDIGLKSLTHIGRGAVRIEKNAELCYVNTIDWSLIARHASQEDHYLYGNKRADECPICPGATPNLDGERKDDSNKIICPESPDGRRLCWNRHHCQKVCPGCGNRPCNRDGKCCSDLCIGGCSDTKLDKCTVCKDYSIGDFTDRQCVAKCPPNHFTHMRRRCITAAVCLAIKKPLEVKNNNKKFPYIPFNVTCSLECPHNYYEVEDGNSRTCRPCNGTCKKSCDPANIDSIAAAQKMQGCTHITGSLEIQIRSQGGLNIVKELEEFLSSIEEIDGYLKVVRSFPLLSLSFLKSLKVIRGTNLENKKYALVVLDNQNLQDLWEEKQKVKIERGKLFFHFNPKLCFQKIEKLKDMISEEVEFVNEDVARSSNGDKIACNVTNLNVTVRTIHSEGVVLEWEPVIMEDERALLGYVVYYIAAPFKNVTLYDGRDACGGDGWKVDDVTEDLARNTTVTHPLTRLEAYTQYAFYVKTYTISTEPTGAQSNIQYFRTAPGTPEIVQRLRTQSNSSSEIVIQWEPPKRANGNLTMYIIKCQLTDNSNLLDQRNYCKQPKRLEEASPISIPTTTKPPEDKCDCEKWHPTRISETEVETQINFEDQLHNYVYIKKIPTRRRRDLYTITNQTDTFPINDDNPQVFPTNTQILGVTTGEEKTKSMKAGDYYTYVYREVNSSITMTVIRELKHYSSYTISVKACRYGNDIGKCGNDAIIYQRTMFIPGADDIQSVSIKEEKSNNSLGSVRVSWKQPENPNNLILSYTIRLQRVDVEHSKPQDICLTQREYLSYGGFYIITGLETGNYSFAVRAASLAVDGNFTHPEYIQIAGTPNNTSILIGVIIASILVVGIGIILFFYYKRHYINHVSNLKLIASVNPDYVSMQYTPDEWEVPRDRITQLRELGQGSFGMVYEGTVKNLPKGGATELRCAIKTVNENATDRERMNFLKEASVMKAFDTHHVVRLLGVVSRGQPILVIMELMAKGDLKGYLRSHRPDPTIKVDQPQPPTLKRILQMAIEIADGMAYLSAKKFVHRDLAARNCMVAEDLTVKIGDFGMTRDIYETDYYRKGTKGLLPVRWMSPESLKDGVFTSSSDVFSYGVVLWEMATLASQPYQGLSNDQVLRYVIDGGVMERPENCPDRLYDLMRECWQHRPSSRPTFMEIVTDLLEDINSDFANKSFYHSPEGEDIRNQQKPDHHVDDATTLLRKEDEALSLDDENYLMERPNSRRLVQDTGPLPVLKPAHSPLSRESGIINDLPSISYRNSENGGIPMNGKQNSCSAATVIQTDSNRQYPGRSSNNSNSIGFLRNTILGHRGTLGGNSSSNGSNSGIGGRNNNSREYKKLEAKEQDHHTDDHESLKSPLENGFLSYNFHSSN